MELWRHVTTDFVRQTDCISATSCYTWRETIRSERSEVISFSHRCDKRLQRLQKILRKRVYYFVHVYLNKNHMSETSKLEEISYSETTVPWFEQREFISDSDSDEDN